MLIASTLKAVPGLEDLTGKITEDVDSDNYLQKGGFADVHRGVMNGFAEPVSSAIHPLTSTVVCQNEFWDTISGRNQSPPRPPRGN
jgi:hypothetical protein